MKLIPFDHTQLEGKKVVTKHGSSVSALFVLPEAVRLPGYGDIVGTLQGVRHYWRLDGAISGSEWRGTESALDLFFEVDEPLEQAAPPQPSLTWQETPPNTPGFWWRRREQKTEAIEVRAHECDAASAGCWSKSSLWAGPVVPPPLPLAHLCLPLKRLTNHRLCGRAASCNRVTGAGGLGKFWKWVTAIHAWSSPGNPRTGDLCARSRGDG